MIKKVETYKKMLSRWKRYIPDTVAVYLALWEQVSVASLMYGIEGICIESDVIDKLEKSQITLGKCILGVRPSTANIAVIYGIGTKAFFDESIKDKVILHSKSKIIGRCVISEEMSRMAHEVKQFIMVGKFKKFG